jgi:hypothetical protein
VAYTSGFPGWIRRIADKRIYSVPCTSEMIARIPEVNDGRQPLESFRQWTMRTSDDEIQNRLRRFIDTADDADEDLFIDWGDNETYSLRLGRGECAA